MLHALNWFAVLCLFALWSLAAWAFHALAAWTASNAGVLAGAGSAAAGLRLPDWLMLWIPSEFGPALTATLAALAPTIETLVSLVPGLAGGLSVVVWVIWAVGSFALVALGFVLSGLIVVMRRRRAQRSGVDL